MGTLLHIVAVLVGIAAVLLYFRSIVRVVLINRRERDFVERLARLGAVSIIHRMARDVKDYNDTQRLQAWVLPLFIFFAVAIWFLLVQVGFTLILWGLRIEPHWGYAFTASGSALSTLGFKTPPSLAGEMLAIFEAAIGLAVVILLFTFVPGYQAAVQVRERKVGWLYARTGRRPTTSGLVEALHRSDQIEHPGAVWDDWEQWFRGVLETHSIAPILAYVPAIYRGTSWLGASASVLDATSILTACLDPKYTESARICREVGCEALKNIAIELNPKIPANAWTHTSVDPRVIQHFDAMFERLGVLGLPMKADKEECRKAFIGLRADYETSVRLIAQSTLMPVDEPWILPHAYEDGPKDTPPKLG